MAVAVGASGDVDGSGLLEAVAGLVGVEEANADELAEGDSDGEQGVVPGAGPGQGEAAELAGDGGGHVAGQGVVAGLAVGDRCWGFGWLVGLGEELGEPAW